MSNLSKVSDYELFAYVASGFWAIAIIDLLIGRQFVFRIDWTISETALMFMASYIVGHILASPAHAVIERGLVHKILLPPSITLLGKDARLERRRLLGTVLLRSYYRPLDDGIRKGVLHRLKEESGTELSGEALFWQAYPVAKNDASVAARISAFLKLYGFCRNMTFINLCGFLLFLVATVLGSTNDDVFTPLDHPNCAVISLLMSLGMMIRFLKFYRLYSVEIFVAYGTGYSNEDP